MATTNERKQQTQKKSSNTSGSSRTNQQINSSQNNRGQSKKINTPANTKSKQTTSEDQQQSKQQKISTINKIVETDEMQSILERSEKYLTSGYPVHFTGAAGVGKTTLSFQLARRFNQPVTLLNGNESLSDTDLLGGRIGYTSDKLIDNYVRKVYKREDHITERWSTGRLLEAVKNGHTLIYDEFTRSLPSTNNLFLSVLEEGILPLYGTQRNESFITVHPNFKAIFTSNPEEYAGVHKSQDALLDRMITIPVEDPNKEAQVSILTERASISEKEAETVIKALDWAKSTSRENDTHVPSFRLAVMTAMLSSEHDVKIDVKNDDFQQLFFDVMGHYFLENIQGEDVSEAQKRMKEELKKV